MPSKDPQRTGNYKKGKWSCVRKCLNTSKIKAFPWLGQNVCKHDNWNLQACIQFWVCVRSACVISHECVCVHMWIVIGYHLCGLYILVNGILSAYHVHPSIAFLWLNVYRSVCPSFYCKPSSKCKNKHMMLNW